MVLVNPHFHLQADVLAAHRVRVALHANHAVGADRHAERSTRRTTLCGQRPQHRAFFSELLLARRVAPSGQLTHKRHVILDVEEVAATAQPQRLVEGILEVAVRRLDVTVFMRLADVDAMAPHTVMCQQVAVLAGELLVVGEVVDRGRQAVATNANRHTACMMQGILQTGGKCLERFRVAEVYVLPVRVGQDGMKQQVIEALAGERDAECVHDYEVERDHVARVMHLREGDLLFDAVFQLPSLHASLQRAADRIGHMRLARGRIVFLLEPIQDRIRLELPIVLQQDFDFRPEHFQWIGARTVAALGPFDLARQLVCLTILPYGLFAHR
jgi:hypothetical protein